MLPSFAVSELRFLSLVLFATFDKRLRGATTRGRTVLFGPFVSCVVSCAFCVGVGGFRAVHVQVIHVVRWRACCRRTRNEQSEPNDIETINDLYRHS
jgi:hypothetical protein